jgi:polysaccharide deacetylase 2 family uncharacterized protein YibQ
MLFCLDVMGDRTLESFLRWILVPIVGELDRTQETEGHVITGPEPITLSMLPNMALADSWDRARARSR